MLIILLICLIEVNMIKLMKQIFNILIIEKQL